MNFAALRCGAWDSGCSFFMMVATPANEGLLTAIQDRASPGSEANGVVVLFRSLNDRQKQELLNFLRSP